MYFLGLIALFLLADQGVKYLVRANMALGESIPVIEGIFHLTYIENPGAAFGILANKTFLFVILTIAIVAVMGWIYIKQRGKNKLLTLSLALVIGGAVGNLIDRVMKATVTDMFDFRIWPVFNIADMCIVVGLGYLAYRLIFHGEEF